MRPAAWNGELGTMVGGEGRGCSLAGPNLIVFTVAKLATELIWSFSVCK
jgi:hypothetical protein